MKTIHLFHIYHSFLLKKWYLMLYLLSVLLLLLVTLTTIQHMTKDNNDFKLGIVDNDKSKETKLILNSIGNGKHLGKNVSIKQLNKQQAQELLKHHQLQGYFVFDKGMTQAFYHQGELPISVYTYDNQSMESVTLRQLTQSVYQRLMLSMGGILTYQDLASKPSKQDSINLMTDLLITGLNRGGAFAYSPIHLYSTGSYYAVTGYLITIFLFALSLFNILKMNQHNILKQRLAMFHFANERLILIRTLLTWLYTLLFSLIGLWWLMSHIPLAFEKYNWPTLALYLGYYITFLLLCLLFIELVSENIANIFYKGLLSIIVILLSGMTIPTIFFQHVANGLLTTQPFALVTDQFLDLLLNNYILDMHSQFYSYFVVMIILNCAILVWRYVR